MLRNLLIPLLAVTGVTAAGFVVAANDVALPPARPLTPPAATPFVHTVAGAGLVEPQSRYINIGTAIAGPVATVHVRVGDRVTTGQPLLTIDDRAVRSELAVRDSELQAAQTRLQRLAAWPRPEDLPPAEAKVAEAKANLDDAKMLLANLEAVADPRAVRREDLTQRRFAVAAAEARHAGASAELAKLRAGAWDQDLAEAKAAVATATANVARLQVECERHVVRAPRDAVVLQVDVRAGEHASASTGAAGQPAMLLGDTEALHVRVDIDENDAWRLRPQAAAFASLRGNPALRAPLRCVHIEPFVVPKRSLTGASFERVDTRVLQIVYAFDPKDLPAYVGQQVDVTIEAEVAR